MASVHGYCPVDGGGSTNSIMVDLFNDVQNNFDMILGKSVA